MRRNKRKYYTGFTLIELMITMFISSILMLIVGVLIVSAISAWQQTYNMAHKQIDDDATAVSLTFGKMGRMANRANYVVYNVAGSTFTPAVSPTPSQDTVVSGNAVEFRYWDVPLTTTDAYQLMDVTKKATAYALFYLDNGQLKVDYGQYPPGGAPAGGGVKNNTIKTVVLARNVSTSPGIGAFSHTSLNGIGKGCVRVNIILTDPGNGQQERVMTAVMMRNKWPQ